MIALPVVVYVTYTPAPTVQARTIRGVYASEPATRERVMVAPTIQPPSQAQLIRHACDAVTEKIISASPPAFPPHDSGVYDVQQLGNITFQVKGRLNIPNGFGIDLDRPFTVHLRMNARRQVRAIFIDVGGDTIHGERESRRAF